MQEHAIFKAYKMTPLQFTSKTVGTAESNISKWAKGEAQIVEKAAANVTRDLMKNHRPRAWFPKAERKLDVLFRAKRKKDLKVSILWQRFGPRGVAVEGGHLEVSLALDAEQNMQLPLRLWKPSPRSVVLSSW